MQCLCVQMVWFMTVISQAVAHELSQQGTELCITNVVVISVEL